MVSPIFFSIVPPMGKDGAQEFDPISTGSGIFQFKRGNVKILASKENLRISRSFDDLPGFYRLVAVDLSVVFADNVLSTERIERGNRLVSCTLVHTASGATVVDKIPLCFLRDVKGHNTPVRHLFKEKERFDLYLTNNDPDNDYEISGGLKFWRVHE